MEKRKVSLLEQAKILRQMLDTLNGVDTSSLPEYPRRLNQAISIEFWVEDQLIEVLFTENEKELFSDLSKFLKTFGKQDFKIMIEVLK